MKLRLILALSLLFAVLISCQCLRKQSGPGPVQFVEHSILIPGTAISAADQAALNKIFRKYNRLLYRIGVYDSGSLKKQIGKMDEIQIGEFATQYSNNATASGLTSWINQIGARNHVTHYPPTTHVTHTGEPTHVTNNSPTHVTHPDPELDKESDALVKEVTPILEKYSK